MYRNALLTIFLTVASVPYCAYGTGDTLKAEYPNESETDIFFDSLALKANRNSWTQRLHNIVILEPSRIQPEDTLHTRLSSEPFLPYSGKIIRNIRITKLDPFGPTIYDPDLPARNRAEAFGNDLHTITQDRVIRNNLLFREGDPVDPDKLADNERLFRRLPFIQDAVIHLVETSPGSDSVDIILLTKDAFFLGLGGEVLDLHSGNLEIFDPNLIGYGHELHTVFHWDGEETPRIGNEVSYIINNLGGSFITGKLKFANVYETESFEFALDRKFHTPDIKYAGALEMKRLRTEEFVDFIDTLTGPVQLKFNLFDGWIGRSLNFGKQRNLTRNRLNLVFATRLYHEQFIDRPEVSENTLYQYQNKTLWLSNVSISSQSFFKSNLILEFGRTEDIPQGILLNLTFGLEMREFKNRHYAGISFSQGHYLGNSGYLYTRIEGGGFLKKQNFVEQGVINLRADYFSNLFIVDRFKIRNFIKVNYVRGIRRFDDEFITLRGKNGIRGFRSNTITGTQKLVLRFESDAFTPYYLYGFRFVLFGFTDMGLIGPDVEPIHNGSFFSGFGLGARIRNERLVFQTISLRLGLYPNHPDMAIPLLLEVAGRERLNPETFRAGKPRIIGFE